jgi:two-component system response regulator FimZ (fimbrial Z protein)
METGSAAAGGILIVEDHATMIALLLELIAGAFPAQLLRTAGSAEEALEVCRSGLPVLAIVDIRLPRANGITTVRRIKALSRGVGVVIHSSYDHEIYREQSLAAGADAFVSKARTYAELVPTIQGLLARSSQWH